MRALKALRCLFHVLQSIYSTLFLRFQFLRSCAIVQSAKQLLPLSSKAAGETTIENCSQKCSQPHLSQPAQQVEKGDARWCQHDRWGSPRTSIRSWMEGSGWCTCSWHIGRRCRLEKSRFSCTDFKVSFLCCISHATCAQESQKHFCKACSCISRCCNFNWWYCWFSIRVCTRRLFML